MNRSRITDDMFARIPALLLEGKTTAANRFMNRDDVIVWLSLTSFVALCGAAIWVLSWPACHVFGIGQ